MGTSEQKNYIVLKALEGNDRPELNSLQEAMLPHFAALKTGWFVLWCLVLCALFVHAVRAYRKQRRGR
jgi:hypothetical protein